MQKPGLRIEAEHFDALLEDINEQKSFILSDGERTIEFVPVLPQEQVQ